MRQIPVYHIDLPAYQVDCEPDHGSVGKLVDEKLKELFMRQHIAVRCLDSVEHPGKSVEELIEIICKLGTDRYDPNRKEERMRNTTVSGSGIQTKNRKQSKPFSEFADWH